MRLFERSRMWILDPQEKRLWVEREVNGKALCEKSPVCRLVKTQYFTLIQTDTDTDTYTDTDT